MTNATRAYIALRLLPEQPASTKIFCLLAGEQASCIFLHVLRTRCTAALDFCISAPYDVATHWDDGGPGTFP